MSMHRKQYFQGLVLGLVLAVFVLGVHMKAQTQGGPLPPNATVITQTATRADAAINCQSTNASAGVLTFGAQPGLTFYLTQLDVENTQSTTGVTVGAVETISTSNLPGSIAWTTPTGANTTPGTNTATFQVHYPTGLKSSIASTATTITNATTIANQVVRINACGFYA